MILGRSNHWSHKVMGLLDVVLNACQTEDLDLDQILANTPGGVSRSGNWDYTHVFHFHELYENCEQYTQITTFSYRRLYM